MEADIGHNGALLSSHGRQLLRREDQHDSHVEAEEEEEGGGAAVRNSKLVAVSPHNPIASLGEQSGSGPPKKATYWRPVGIGDVHAITVDGDAIYAVGTDEKYAMLEKGIFMQPLNDMTPFSNWTLIGYGSMSSIAIYNSRRGKLMYGVGNKSWLWNQEIATMPKHNVWSLASIFPLTSIAICGDTIYGISPDHPNQIWSESLLVRGPQAIFHGWQKVGTGEVKSFSVLSGGLIFAIMKDTRIYNKQLASAANHYADVEWSAFNMQDNETGMQSIAVWGDTVYGASTADHQVYRKPLRVNEKWAQLAQGRMRSLAVDTPRGIIYGAHFDGKVYKQDLAGLMPLTDWEPASSDSLKVMYITIQGETIYAVSDNKVYKQPLHTMSADTGWHLASKCCVLQIAAADGIIYAIGVDYSVYSQAALLMTVDTDWIQASKPGVFSIAIRGDTIFGLGLDNVVKEQPISRMTKYSQWTPSELEDSEYPSKKYLSIMAHNDVMYACGKDMKVYTKLIDKTITYPPGLSKHGNTQKQALHWNLTDLPAPPTTWVPPTTTPLFRASTTTQPLVIDGTTTTQEFLLGATTTTISNGETTTTVAKVVDCYNDRQADGCGKAKDSGRAWQSSPAVVLLLAPIALLRL